MERFPWLMKALKLERKAQQVEEGAEVANVVETASTPFGRLVQSFKSGGWRRVSAHAEPATAKRYKGGTSIEEVFKHGSDQLVRHRIYSASGKILHETFRPYAKF